jgi:hypothetical protein
MQLQLYVKCLILDTTLITKLTLRHSFRCNRCKIINIENDEISYKSASTVRKVAMPLLLRKTLRNAVALCAFEKIRKPITDKK